jgi:predicted PurR-regulated permease PerM
MPIALAVLLTFLLNPIARRLQGLGMSRLVAVILAVVLAGAALTAVGVTGSRQVTGMLSNLPENTAKIVAKVKSLKALASGPTAQRFEQMVEAVSRELRPPVHSPTGEQEDSVETQVDRVILASETFSWATLTGHLGSAMEGLAMLAFAAVLLVFFLMDREGLRDRIVLLAGRSRLTVTSKALEDATNRVSRYIGMVAVVNGGFGLLLCIGLYLMGVPYAVLWGCLAAGLRFLPYLGPWIGAVFPIAMSLALSDGWWQPLAVFTYIMILELVTNNVVEPLAFGHTTGVAPAALLISAAFWLFIWGPVGLILSAPFAVSLVVIGKNIPQLRFLYVLLGDQPALRDDASFYQRLLAQDHTEIRTSIANHVHDSSVESLFDNLIVPAIVYTKQDVRREHLSDEEGAAVLQVLRESVLATDLPRTPDGASSRDDDNRRLTLLACPIDGEPDRFALSLLGIVTDADHWNVQVVADGILMSEIVSQLASDPPAAVCITSIKPDGIVHARSWCKKIRAAAPNIPLIVCRLGQQRHLSHSARTRLMEVGATTVTCSLQETRRWLSARYPVLHDDATRPDLKSPINRGHAEPAISRSA